MLGKPRLPGDLLELMQDFVGFHHQQPSARLQQHAFWRLQVRLDCFGSKISLAIPGQTVITSLYWGLSGRQLMVALRRAIRSQTLRASSRAKQLCA